MNQQDENPFASPRADSFTEVLPDEEQALNTQFFIQGGLVVGESPLSLPEVCFYCAADIVDADSLRQCGQFYRTRLVEGRSSITYKVYYSTCSVCRAGADAWRRRRRYALSAIVVVFFVGCATFAALGDLLPPNQVNAGVPEAVSLIFGAIGGCLLLRSFYCERKLPKRPELARYALNTISIRRAGKAFMERFH